MVETDAPLVERRLRRLVVHPQHDGCPARERSVGKRGRVRSIFHEAIPLEHFLVPPLASVEVGNRDADVRDSGDRHRCGSSRVELEYRGIVWSASRRCRRTPSRTLTLVVGAEGAQTVSTSAQEQPTGPTTLAIDIGGTGLKASVLDADGRKLVDRVRTKTPYPCPPRVLIRELDKLTYELPRWDRVSVGFPGFVRAGRVLTAPNLSTKRGPGTPLSRKLVEAWAGFPLAAELEGRLGKPTRVFNDADMHGLAVISGKGLELVLTLGTGLGTAVFLDGVPTPHLELALMPFQGRGTFQDQLGNDTRRRIGNHRWSERVLEAVEMFDTLLHIDRLYVGGGNAKKLTVDLGHRVELIDNAAGILGGIKLWELEHV